MRYPLTTTHYPLLISRRNGHKGLVAQDQELAGGRCHQAQAPLCGDRQRHLQGEVLFPPVGHQLVCVHRRHGDSAHRAHRGAHSLHAAARIHPRLYRHGDDRADLCQRREDRLAGEGPRQPGVGRGHGAGLAARREHGCRGGQRDGRQCGVAQRRDRRLPPLQGGQSAEA